MKNYLLAVVLVLLLPSAAFAQEEAKQQDTQAAQKAVPQPKAFVIDDIIKALLAIFVPGAIDAQSVMVADSIVALNQTTQQRSASSRRIRKTTVDSSKLLAAGMLAVDEHDQLLNVRLDFDGGLGQGFSPCLILNKNLTMANVSNRLSKITADMKLSIYNNPGRITSGSTVRMDRKAYQRMFCSQADVDQGVCEKVGELPSGNVNASSLFSPSNAVQNDPLHVAKTAYINNIMGPPDPVLSWEAGKLDTGRAYRLSKLRKDSLMSIPLHSLTHIAASNSSSYVTGSPLTLNELIEDRTNQYFGGEQADAWAKTLVIQRERGLLVENVKIAGLEAWLRYQQYEQNKRLEANLAALVISAAEKNNVDVKGKASKVSGQAIKGVVQ